MARLLCMGRSCMSKPGQRPYQKPIDSNKLKQQVSKQQEQWRSCSSSRRATANQCKSENQQQLHQQLLLLLLQQQQQQRQHADMRLEQLPVQRMRRNVGFALAQAETEVVLPVAADARCNAPSGLCSSFHSLAKAPSPSCSSTTPTTAAGTALSAAAVIALPAAAEAIALPAASVIALPATAAIALAVTATASEAGLLNFILPLRSGIQHANVEAVWPLAHMAFAQLHS
ncbi:hypothetical protein Emed_006972 [Eimeria media]